MAERSWQRHTVRLLIEINAMPTIDWLKHHMHQSALVAQWLHAQFPYEFVEQPLADWQREFAAGQRNGDWQSLIAFENGRLLGSASLARDDLPQRPELGPWLACVYVQPESRGRGLAERLIDAICIEARQRGHTTLYLHTHDRSAYYAKRGWRMIESFHAWGETQSLMCQSL